MPANDITPSPEVVTLRSATLDYTRILNLQSAEMDNSIRHADLKAQLILGVDAILLATIEIFPFDSIDPLFSNGASIISRLIVLLELIVVMGLAISLVTALLTILPRFNPAKSVTNLFFFGDITRMSQAEYISTYMDTPEDDIKIAILAQIHAKSFIVTKKFWRVRYSLLALLIAVMAWALVAVFSLMTG
ncbi:MAG: hypothetical protein KC546_14740 [Anaerolineae bacterium]|nr:hypothetical protein [Anaerolineae bacterium]MCA9895025.1 hypothetical protein [Anaerolineae bacterium]MCB9459578.1 hypothetical protein [Anaerolineaceae bacterium]